MLGVLSRGVEIPVAPVLELVGAPTARVRSDGIGGEGHAEEQELRKSPVCRLLKSARGLTFCEGPLLWISIHSTPPCRSCSMSCWRLRRSCRRQPNLSTPIVMRSSSVRLSRTGPLMAESCSIFTTSGGRGVEEAAQHVTCSTVQSASLADCFDGSDLRLLSPGEPFT
jgi:hypothetical protein